MKRRNIFSDLPDAVKKEVFQTLQKGKDFKIERIVSHGQATPKGTWIYEKTAEWVILLKGKARLAFKKDKKLHDMKDGDYFFIPPGTFHRVEWTDPKQKTVWLAVHLKVQE